ncbi:MAG: hypothetical protein R3F34_09665 [Planctomycetota bacterium]
MVEHVRRCGTSVVQLVDAVADATYRALREACPSVRVVQVVHVEDRGALSPRPRTRAARRSPCCSTRSPERSDEGNRRH